MNRIVVMSMLSVGLCVAPVPGQERAAKTDSAQREAIAPIYNVTVIDRGVGAINYAYRSGPTKIDFRGTVLLSNAKGEATVQSRQGHTEIDAKFENLAAPERFGPQFLTYVLWAISPEGASHNLGEIVADSSNHGRKHVTTELQAFGLIVTAEPYAAVRQPGDVVTLENQFRPDTVGKIEPIQASYELLPRSHYTWQVPGGQTSEGTKAPKVSMDQYEAILEVYQAQNAVAIARAANAEKYAPRALAKAEQALSEAQRLQSKKGPTKQIVQNAREAAQTAEDARVISEQRKRDEELSTLRGQAGRQVPAQGSGNPEPADGTAGPK